MTGIHAVLETVEVAEDLGELVGMADLGIMAVLETQVILGTPEIREIMVDHHLLTLLRLYLHRHIPHPTARTWQMK